MTAEKKLKKLKKERKQCTSDFDLNHSERTDITIERDINGEEIPKEETEVWLRSTIIGRRDIFNNMMPKKTRKRPKGRFGTKEEKKLKMH